MKNFITSHKKIVLFSVMIIVLALILTTAGITGVQLQNKSNISVSDINTCSIPTGKITAHGIDVSKYQGDIDFKKVKELVSDKLDHQYLNEVVDFNPTAENMAKWICDKVPFCYKVSVQESEGNIAIYEEEVDG